MEHSEQSDQVLLPFLLQRSEKAFELVFKRHYKALHSYACAIVKSEVQAEEMVQQVFFKLWERVEKIQISSSVAAYLYRAVHNECLNHLKHLKVRAMHQAYVSHQGVQHTKGHEQLPLNELQQHITRALEKLPEQCRTIFQMSRFEELKYKEIADKLGISIKTVEHQMGKALRIMREELIAYLPICFLYMLNLLNHQL